VSQKRHCNSESEDGGKMLRLGWKKDKFDQRDYLHRVVGIEIIPDHAILDKIPNVRDQGNEGSCVGFGVGANLTYWALKLGIYTEWFSPTWIYNGARFIEGSLTQDAGCEPGDALDWLKKMGCLLEHFWPYKDVLDKQAPPSSLNPEAAKYPLIAYYRVTGDANGICSAIAAGNVVSIGTPWFDKWMDTSGDLPVVNEDDSTAGGHETYLYGYDKAIQKFYGSNSWGTEWGIKGRYLMPFGAFPVFKKLGGYDAHYINVNWGQAPAPTPTPPTPPPTPTTKIIRLQDSFDGGKTWKNLGVSQSRSTNERVRLQESVDLGKTWKTLFDQNI
jgi:hypothetical protein